MATGALAIWKNSNNDAVRGYIYFIACVTLFSKCPSEMLICATISFECS